jgi:hypothetical protein
VQSSARPGNARGNALSTNAAQPRVRLITQYSSTDDGSTVAVRVPLAPLVGAGGAGQAAALATQHVRASFAPRSFELEVLSDGGAPHLLRVSLLPGELHPEVSASLRTLAPSKRPHLALWHPPGMPAPRGRHWRGRGRRAMPRQGIARGALGCAEGGSRRRAPRGDGARFAGAAPHTCDTCAQLALLARAPGD